MLNKLVYILGSGVLQRQAQPLAAWSPCASTCAISLFPLTRAELSSLQSLVTAVCSLSPSQPQCDTNLPSAQQAIIAEPVNRQGHMGNVWVCEGDSYAGASLPPQATDRDGQTPVVTLFHCGVKFPSGSSYGPSHHPNQIKGWQGLKKWEVLVPSHAFIFAVVSLKTFWFCEALPVCRCL